MIQPRKRRASVVVLATSLVCASVLTAQEAPASDDRGEAYYHFALGHLYQELAKQFARQEYVDRAVEEYRKAIAADPESDYPRRELIRLYAATNNLDEALAEANQALEAQPNNPEMRQLLGSIYAEYATDRRAGPNPSMLAQAIAEYEKAVELRPEEFDWLLQLARLYGLADQRDRAGEMLSKALEIKPGSNQAVVALASLQLESGDAAEAVRTLESAASDGDDFGNRRAQLLAQAYQQTGQFKEAAALLERLIAEVNEGGGSTVPLREQLARSQMLAGMFDEAAEQYEALLEAQPRNSEYHLRLAQIRGRQRRFSDAWAALKRAEETAPAAQQLEIQYHSVGLLEAEQRHDEAIDVLETILKSTEKSEYEGRDLANRLMFLEQLASLHRAKEDFDGASKVYDRIEKLQPDARPRVLALKVEALRAKDDFVAAEKLSAAAVAEFPDDQSLLFQRANLLAEIGRATDGAALLRPLTEDGDDIEALLTLARVYEKGKLFDQAIEAVEQAAEVAEGETARLNVLFTHGSVLERAKRIEEAEAKFRELLAIDPDNSSALNYLGYMLADQEMKLGEAHDMIQKALDLEPNNGAYLDSLGWVYYRQGKFELAERYLVRSLEQFGRDPVVHSHLGDVYYKLGKKEEARRHWERGLKEFQRGPKADQDPVAMDQLREKLSQLGVREVTQAEEEAGKKDEK